MPDDWRPFERCPTGPIVRVNPHELSIHDPDFYNQLYVAGSVRRTDNWSHFGKGVDFDGQSR